MEGNYAIYLRKSRADQEAEERGEGETLARHRRILLSLAKKMDITITHIYPELVSGESIDNRPEIQQLLKEVSDGKWNGVLVMEVERLARGDTVDQGIIARTFKESNTKIITPQKTFDPSNEFDEEYFEFSLFMSRREYKVINRRQQRGREESAKEGRWVSSKEPFGYKRVTLPDKGFTLEIVPEEAEIVKLIFDWYINGIDTPEGNEQMGTTKISRKLNEMKIKTSKNSKWVPSTIRSMIRNETYIGMVRWKHRATKKVRIDGEVKLKRGAITPGRSYEGLHKPIIDKETFLKAQDIMDRSGNSPVSKLNLANPMAGIVRCGKCGDSMIRRIFPNVASQLTCVNQLCDNKGARLDHVEKALIQSLNEWVANYSVDISTTKKEIDLNFYKTSVRNAEGNLNQLYKQNSNLHDLVEQGVYTVDKFLERSQELAVRIKEAEEFLKNSRQDLQNQMNREKAKTEIIPTVKNVISAYKKTDDIRLKNILLKSVIDKAMYRKEKWQRNDDFELILHPKVDNI